MNFQERVEQLVDSIAQQDRDRIAELERERDEYLRDATKLAHALIRFNVDRTVREIRDKYIDDDPRYEP